MKTKVSCTICPKGCQLAPGETGDCRVRANIDGKIRCTTYGHPCSISVDPIEKKPLFHFLPGSPIFSMATPGCNLHCKQCQNWQISQTGDITSQTDLSPEELVRTAKKQDCKSIAYTYTEPLVSYEYTYDCCKIAAEMGINNILVTAAYINPDPLRKICEYVDAANVDLKAFSDKFYQDVCGATLKPVLNALKTMKESGVMLEITNLIIPTLNDSVDECRQLCDWVYENLGAETPLHFSRFFPQNQLSHLPPTPPETIERACEIATETGLRFVYSGNMRGMNGENTYCPDCGALLIERSGYKIRGNSLENGQCPSCETKIYGIWK